MSEKSNFDTWALVELFGHQKIVGHVTEQEIAGKGFIRVDVPDFNGEKSFTRFYGPDAIYSLNPVSEEVARGLLTRYRNAPVQAYEMPLIENSDAEQYEDSAVQQQSEDLDD